MKGLRRVRIAAAAIALAAPWSVLSAPAAQAESCQYKANWPLCYIRKPSFPRFDLGGGRPPLTPKNSQWCNSKYIQADSQGYIYWALTQSTKYVIRFYPDYYGRYYQAMYWDGGQWAWIPVDNSYPDVLLGQQVYCDA